MLMPRRSTKRVLPGTARVMLVAALLVTSTHARAQERDVEWHPALQAVWQNSDTWTLVTPADLKLDPAMLVGLHATYHRTEGSQDPLIEEVGFQFERGWLHGEPVLLARYFTSGDRSNPESGPTLWTRILDPRRMENLGSMALSFRFGASATRKTETGTTSWRLGLEDTDWSEPQVREGQEPMIDMAVWAHVLASMQLEEGMNFRLQGIPTWLGQAFHVAGRTTIEDTQGNVYPVWAVETTTWRGESSGWLGITYVRDEAPYFMGFEMRHVESGDVAIRWRLRSFERLSS